MAKQHRNPVMCERDLSALFERMKAYGASSDYDIVPVKDRKGTIIRLHKFENFNRYSLSLYGTDLLSWDFHANYVVMRVHGNSQTSTTKRRINEFLPNGFYVYVVKGQLRIHRSQPSSQEFIAGESVGQGISFLMRKIEGGLVCE